jgi:MFS superfamily sulfate permease-like transporter
VGVCDWAPTPTANQSQNNNKIKTITTMKKLLKLKELNPTDKLVILTIQDNLFFGECNLTSQELANSIGLTRKVTLDSIQKLCEMDYITCKVDGSYRRRLTKITQRLQNLIKE